jgi:predicted metal-dependent enzyme (double-stranded beta helix superfamily)
MTDAIRKAVSRRKVMAGAMLALAPRLAAAQSPDNTPHPERPSMRAAKFDREEFAEACRKANMEVDSQAAVTEVLKRAVSDHAAVLAALGPPTQAGLDVLLRSPDLTIFAAKWTPRMNLPPHDHRMWAAIGIYTGREDNIFWRRKEGRLRAFTATSLFEGDVASMPADAVHSVTNPLLRFTGGLHIYGGDFFQAPRSQWDPESLAEQPSDGDVIRAIFEAENARLQGPR